jgi:threonyl-tRNA synthetase
VIATITNDSDEYAKKVLEQLKSHGFRAEADLDAQKISYKIREYSLRKIPYIIAVGKKEAESDLVSVRKLGEENQHVMSLKNFIEMAKDQIKEKK